MADILGHRDPYLTRGVLVMVITIAFYALLDDPFPVLTGLYAALFVVGAILAVGSPTRWSVSTTLRLYQAIPLLFGTSAVVASGYYLLTTDVSVLAGVGLAWGFFLLGALAIGPWEEVEAYLERVKAPETEAGRGVAPLPRRRLLQLRYATVGLTIVSFAVILERLLVDPDLGHAGILGGVGGAGLLHIVCSPYSGSPGRVVRLRQVRWAILGLGTGTSSLYGALVVDATLPAVFLGVVTLGIVYWAVVRTSWDEVREGVADAQSERVVP